MSIEMPKEPPGSMRPLEKSIEVYVGEDGEVCIAHVDMSEDCSVAIPPEQVDLLIEWLKKKRTEAIKFKKTLAVSK